jgi:hypothetical protein
MTKLLALIALFGAPIGALAACEKSSSQQPAQAVGVDNAAIDAMVEHMLQYTDQMLPLDLAWDGDCAAQAKRLMVLEPLGQKIRAESRELEADDAKRTAFKAAMAGKRDEVMAKVKQHLAAAGVTEADIDKRTSEMETKCANDPAFVDAMNRVGLRKKSK